MAGPHSFGTDIRRSFDSKRLGEAIAAPGVDLRYWCSMADVCTVDHETGECNYQDKHAIWNDSAGVDVDVMLQPLGIPCTCKYAGESAGEVTVVTPIRPGDVVLVQLPDGDLNSPVITKILHSRSRRQPVEGGKPIFDNARMLIFAKAVPIDIRTAGKDGSPVQVLIEQDGTATVTAKRINLGDHNASEQFVLGSSYRAAENTEVDDLRSAFVALESAAQGALTVLKPGMVMAQEALLGFKTAAQASNDFLSDTVYGKK